MIGIIGSTYPVQAAERVYLSFAAANVSVSVESLERYVEQGGTSPELESYLLLLNPQEKEQFRNTLQNGFQIDPVIVSRFLNSPTGEIFLEKLGELIQAQFQEGNRPALYNGSNSIRTALIRAAEEPRGISLLGVLRQFPSEGIQLDTQLLLDLRDQIDTLLRQTEAVIAEIVKLSTQQANQDPPTDFTQQPDLQHSGPFKAALRPLILKDQGRNRSIPVDLYLPEPLSSESGDIPSSLPVVVISHGLASDRTNYKAFGQHLASHGFAAALIQHPGSDSFYMQSLLSGQVTDVFELEEFINRPLDVSYLLDELERRNVSEFQGKLDVSRVGVAGHSFGAYTALALAGAEIDFANLEAACTSSGLDSLNLAQMFQCRALELPQQRYALRDERIKAIMPINPVNSSIFGQRSLGQVQVPIFWKTSGDDKVTPVAWEQVRSFTWLTTPHRYLLLVEKDNHINLDFDGKSAASSSLYSIVEPVPETISRYVNAMGLAFFKLHVAQETSYAPFLQASYARAISQESYPLSLVDSITSEQFFRVLRQVRKIDRPLL
ncbi:MAG: alpha/beta hydrolase [Microcoleaceae cyanobacterium]